MVISSVLIFGISFLILLRAIPIYLNLIFSTLKAGLFLGYFFYYYPNLPFQQLDDTHYLKMGQQICNLEFSWNLTEILGQLGSITQSVHLAYPIYNCLISKIGGTAYFIPVMGNAIIATYAAVLAINIFNHLAFGEKTPGKSAAVYHTIILFIPEFWVWTTLLNLKEALLCATVLFIYNHIVHKEKINFKIMVISLILLFTLRYYAVFFFIPIFLYLVSNVVFPKLFNGRIEKKSIFYLLICGVLAVFIGQELADFVREGLRLFSTLFNVNLRGLMKFFLSPKPLGIDVDQQFLFLFAVINPILMVFFAIGCLSLFMSGNKNKHVLLIFIITIAMFYSLVPDLNGPRQRLIVSNFNYIVICLGIKSIRSSFA